MPLTVPPCTEPTTASNLLMAVADARLTAPAGSLVETRVAEMAGAVARQLREHAIRLTDGSPTWLATTASPGVAQPLGPHLYAGTTGIALFLAAHYRFAGYAADHQLALQAIDPLRRKLGELVAEPDRGARLRLGVGGLVGLGSFVYAFTRMADWLDEPDLVVEARRLLALLTPERIASDDRLDVMSGCAGALLAVLALDRRAPGAEGGDELVAVAEALGRRLLEARVSFAHRPLAWPGPEGRPPLSGFAHGAAGIAYALLRLFDRTRREEYRHAALEGYAYERSLSLGPSQGWLDPRSERPVEQSAWCHGAPGIALGRLGGLKGIDDDTTRQEMSAALSTTLSLPQLPLDHLCCGNAGQIEILFTAGRRLERNDLAGAARCLAERILERAGAAAQFSFTAAEAAGSEKATPVFSPSLFLGAAGVGYTFLRLIGAEDFPCLLLMD